MPKRYLVTGGAGFIGSHIVRRLVSEGAEVRVVDNLSTGLAERLDDMRESVDLVRGDLANQQVSEEAVKGIDCVLHQAAVPSVQRSVSDPVGTNRANVTATVNLLNKPRHKVYKSEMQILKCQFSKFALLPVATSFRLDLTSTVRCVIL